MDTIQQSKTWRVVGGLVLILIGTLFLLGNLIGVQTMAFAGPLMVLVFGSVFFVGMFAGGRQTGALAIPGSMFVILGLMLLVQNILDAGESWAYAWSLFAPAGVGVGLVIYSWWSVKPELKRPGYILITIGLVIFIVFGMFFEAFFGLFGSGMSNTVLLSLGLIGLGVLLLVGRMVRLHGIIEWLPPHNEARQDGDERALTRKAV